LKKKKTANAALEEEKDAARKRRVKSAVKMLTSKAMRGDVTKVTEIIRRHHTKK